MATNVVEEALNSNSVEVALQVALMEAGLIMEDQKETRALELTAC